MSVRNEEKVVDPVSQFGWTLEEWK